MATLDNNRPYEHTVFEANHNLFEYIGDIIDANRERNPRKQITLFTTGKLARFYTNGIHADPRLLNNNPDLQKTLAFSHPRVYACAVRRITSRAYLQERWLSTIKNKDPDDEWRTLLLVEQPESTLPWH